MHSESLLCDSLQMIIIHEVQTSIVLCYQYKKREQKEELAIYIYSLQSQTIEKSYIKEHKQKIPKSCP